MGARVFPQAPVKFFLEASPTERARRRHAEFVGAGQAAELAETQRELEARDGRDRTRESAPLTAAPDAVIIDTGRLTVVEVVERMVRLIARKTAALRLSCSTGWRGRECGWWGRGWSGSGAPG